LIPVLPGLSGNVALQAWVITLAICCTTIVQQQLLPWRSYVANVCDGLLSVCLVLLLMTGVMATDMAGNLDSIKAAGIFAFVVFAIVVGGTLSFGVFTKFKPQGWYQYFICHHAGQAAAQVRLLKLLIQKRTHSDTSVFIDSDSVQEMDALFDIVKSKLDHLVVYLTRETLSTPWCAGEITTAFACSRVKVIVVKTESFVTPSDEQMKQLVQSINLAAYNIPREEIAEAFNKLQASSTTCIQMPDKISSGLIFDSVVGQILGGGAAQSAENNSLPPIPMKSMVLISSMLYDCEAIAAASILNSKIQEDVKAVAEGGSCLLVNHDPDIDGVANAVARATAVVVVLTQGTMQSLQQLAAIVELMTTISSVDQHPPQVIPVNTPGFIFPNEAYYQEAFPSIWPGDSTAAAVHMQSFFKQIAVFFPTNDSDSILDKQAMEVVSLIPKNFDSKVASLRKTTSDGLRAGVPKLTMA
jgi:hypothetical protein